MQNSFFVSRRHLPKDKTYAFSGATMSYSVIGHGKPIVLLHGSMIANPWKGFEKKLAKYYTVYLPHLPGFGASDAVNGRLHTTDLFAEALSAFIEKTKLDQVPLVALSLGTVVAIKSAINGCTRGSLIVIGMPVKFENRNLKTISLIPVWIRRLIGSTIWGRKTILIPILRGITGAEGKKSDQELLDDLSSTDTRSLVDIDVYTEIEQQMPTLLPRIKNKVVYIYGSKDTLADYAKAFVKNPIRIEGADHNIFTSQPQKSLAILRNILR
jgi:pimeloyl-ACP methyl ester carboxylesterase